MIIRLGYESSIYWINWVFDRIDYKKELNDFYNYLNN